MEKNKKDFRDYVYLISTIGAILSIGLIMLIGVIVRLYPEESNTVIMIVIIPSCLLFLIAGKIFHK